MERATLSFFSNITGQTLVLNGNAIPTPSTQEALVGGVVTIYAARRTRRNLLILV